MRANRLHQTGGVLGHHRQVVAEPLPEVRRRRFGWVTHRMRRVMNREAPARYLAA